MVSTKENSEFTGILKGFGDMGKMLAQSATGMHRDEKILLARKWLDMSIAVLDDQSTVMMLKLLEYAVKEGVDSKSADIQRFRRELEQIFWALPGRTPGLYGSQECLVTAKLHIVRALIREWVPSKTDESVHAFRRLIAMGWPMAENAYRGHESDVEWFKGRGRFVSDLERRGISDIIREHMQSFVYHDERKNGPDAMFAPWFGQPHVPDDIRNLLVVARAKMGGPDMAIRDIRNAQVFEGLPSVVIERLQDVIGPVREILATCESIREQLVAKIRKNNPHWQESSAPLKWEIWFPSINQVEIVTGPDWQPGKLMADIGAIIEQSLKDKKAATWHLTVIVRDVFRAGHDPLTVTAKWEMA